MVADSYQMVKEKLQYHKMDSEQLIILYYCDRLREQGLVESTEYGVLSVRAYYHHDSLCVEVLNAKDVIPLDTNGKCIHHINVTPYRRTYICCA